MDPSEHTVPDIPPEILSAHDPHQLIRRKQANHRLRKELNQHRHGDSEAHSDHDGILQSLRRPVVLACTNILGTEGGNRRKHGRRHQKYETDDLLHDSHRCCITQASPVSDNSNDDKCHLDQPVLTGHRNAYTQQLSHNFSLWF